MTQRSDKSAPATGGRTRRGHRRTGRPPLSPRHDAHPPRPAAGGQRPSGGAAAADRRRRPPRVPLRLRRRGHCRVHHARLPTPRCPRASGPLTLRDHAGTVDVRGRPTAASPRALPAPRHRPDPGPKSPRGTPAPRRTGRRPQTGACEAGDRGRYSAHRDCVSYPALVSSAALGDAPTRTTLIERSIGSASVEGDAAVAVAGEADCWRQAAVLAEETAKAVAATGASGAALAAAAEFPSPWRFVFLGCTLRQSQKEYGEKK